MTIRHLDSLFAPRSIAVIGATDRPSSVGATVWRNVSCGGFAGPIWPVHPTRRELGGVPVYGSVADLPEAPELAVICTPASTVPGLIAELGGRGTQAAVVLTAGLDAAAKAAMHRAARPHLLRMLGPNCIGMLSPHHGINASFAHVGAKPGELAFVSQSGALTTALLDWAAGRGIGFSHMASIGESLDIDVGDLLDFLATDPRTRAVLMYLESVQSPAKFMSAARAAARNKPVIVIKAGRSSQGQAAAASHTGALAGSDPVFDAAVRRAGMLRVDSLQDLFLAAETLSRGRGPSGLVAGSVSAAFTAALDLAQAVPGQGLVILTNGGGAGVMAADAAAALAVPLATLSAATVARLDVTMPATWSRRNPVDIIGDAPAERYGAAVDALLADPACETLLFIQAPTAIVPSTPIAEALVPLARAARARWFSCWLGDVQRGAVAEAARVFREAGIPAYPTPEDAVRAIAMQQTYRRHQAELLQTPRLEEEPAGAPTAGAETPAQDRRAAVRPIVDAALAEGRTMLSEAEAKTVLSAFGVPVVPTRVVRLSGTDDAAVAACVADAVAAADGIGWPVALKVLSASLSHKSDVGGVALNLASADALREALTSMRARVRRLRPDAVIQGFTVQAMVRRGHAQELIVGASIDPVFGPVVLFGQGGTAVEVLADRAIGLPPLNEPLARSLVDRTRVARLLAGFRDVPPADRAALHRVLVAVSTMLAELPELAELDINPLLVDDQGVIALDARLRLSADRPAGAARFSISPYPVEWIRKLEWQGRAVTLRPIRPEDEAQHREFLESLDPEDLRLRIFHTRRSIEHSELARLTQIDYAREMAVLAVECAADGSEKTLGVARAVADPDRIEAEFGLIVRSELKGRGLGDRLLNLLIEFERSRGTQRLVGTVLRGNARMLALATRHGFAIEAEREGGAGEGAEVGVGDSDTLRIVLPLAAGSGADQARG
jgi:acetyltransferase